MQINTQILVRWLIISSILFIVDNHLSAQLVINEICASNGSTIEDQYGETSDWIELFNTSENTITLDDYFLTDDPDQLEKWVFPNIQIPSDGRLLIFASSRDEFGAFHHTNFKLSASGESVILSQGGIILDRLDFSALETDQSIGRVSDGAPEWVLFNTPTPNQSNNLSIGTGTSQPPSWGIDDNFSTSNIQLSLEHSNPDARIFFTRTGKIPTEDDEEYITAIQIDTTTAIRAIAFEEGKLASSIVSRTYFINTSHSLPVISIMGDPDDFWSWERGILVNGGPNAETEWPFWGSNYWVDREIPVNVEYFESSGELGIEFRSDLKTHGGRGARVNPMKPMRILVKKKYGFRTLDYPFFYNRDQIKFKRIVLRNASGDYNNAHCRDAFLARYFIDSNLDLDVLAHQPVAVYVNGAFYGIENLREKSDEYYLQHHYNVDIDQLDLLEEDTLISKGDFVIFDSMHQYITTHDLSEQANFDVASSMYDEKNIAEGFIVQSALNNGDWLHNNTKFWRERKEGARWRYFIFDLDIAMGRHGWSDYKINNFGDLLNNYADSNRHVNIFRSFLNNETYRFYFINRYADLLNTIFRPSIFRHEVDRTLAELEPEMPLHFDRWQWPGFDVWKNDRTPKLYEYLEERPAYARDDIREYFDLPNEITLQLNTYPEGAGLIKINTISPDELPWDGVYFNGVPVTLTILPSPGFTFDHWQSTHTITTNDENTMISYNFEQDDEVVAYFNKEKDGPTLSTYLLNRNALRVNMGLEQSENITFTVFDIQGRLLKYFPSQVFGGGQQQTVLTLPEMVSGLYILTMDTDSQRVNTKFLIF